MNDKPLLSVISQGCAANFGDGEKIARIFSREYEVVFGNTETAPDAFVLNVCTVKGNAGAIKLLRQALETAPNAKIYITGCTPKDFREEALKISRNITFTNLKELGSPDSSQVLRQSPQVGIVNIEEGCLDACAYCSTRLVKGRLHSFSADSIVQQVKQLVSDGCREIN